jgi:hypothetical protein
MNEALFLITIIASQGSQHQVAQALAEVYIKENNIDDALDAYQKKYITEHQRIAIARTANIAKIVIERRVTFEWRF